jgi:Helix-turn-helix domain
LSQAQVGTSLGRSDAWVSWTETGRNDSLSVVDLSAMLACVGLQLSVRAYPASGGLRDGAQVALLAAFRAIVAPTWGWASEVPMPIPGDLRAWDAVLSRPACRIGVDAETRLNDAQAVDRRVMLKLRDSGVDRAIILVAGTRTNRSVLREFGPAVRTNFPVASAPALKALIAGADPGGNAIVILDLPLRPHPGR